VKISAITKSINEAKRHVEAMSRVVGVQQRLEVSQNNNNNNNNNINDVELQNFALGAP